MTTELCMPVQLLPMLASALEYGGAPSLALGALLQIGKTLDADAFAAQVVPVLSKLFTSNDRTIRRSLLESIDTYGTHFSEVVRFVFALYTCIYRNPCSRCQAFFEALEPLWPLGIALQTIKCACACAECCGEPSVPACGNRVLRQQCIPARADPEEHASPRPKAVPEDSQPVAPEVPGQATGQPDATHARNRFIASICHLCFHHLCFHIMPAFSVSNLL